MNELDYEILIFFLIISFEISRRKDKTLLKFFHVIKKYISKKN